jgi:antitoxin PrlF
VSKATITSKGQVTIPKAVRELLHLHSGDKVDFVVSEKGEAIMRPVAKSAREVFGLLAKKGQARRSVQEMDDAVRKAMSRAAR